jgi:hypothetical protein
VDSGAWLIINLAPRNPGHGQQTAVKFLMREDETIREENMKNLTKLIVVAVAVAGLLTASKAVAQRNYDPKTVETVQGKVLSVEKMQQRGCGVQVMLQTDKETIAVHLGPSCYIDNQRPRIEANDIITVTGSRVTVDGKPDIIAAQVKKGDETLKLRDENGIPVWRRGARGNR